MKTIIALMAMTVINTSAMAACGSTRIYDQNGSHVEHYGCPDANRRNRQEEDRRQYNEQRGYGPNDERGTNRYRREQMRRDQEWDRQHRDD